MALWAKDPLRAMGSSGKDGRERVTRMSLLFGGYLMIVTIASIGVAFCLGSILLTESVIFRCGICMEYLD